MRIDNGFDVGDQVTVTTTFTDVDGVLTSPVAVYADYLKPGATQSIAVTPIVQSEGVVTVALPVFDVAGSWLWYVKGTDGLIAADQGEIRVNAKHTGADATP